MRISWRSKYDGEIETLKLKKEPLGLGYYEDVDGKLWDVVSIVGADYTTLKRPYINARPVDNSPYYSTATYGHSCGSHSWKPYYFEVIKEEEHAEAVWHCRDGTAHAGNVPNDPRRRSCQGA